MTGTDDPTPNRHRDIATRLLDGRTSAGAPVVSPDGRRIAFVVATIDLDEERHDEPRLARRARRCSRRRSRTGPTTAVRRGRRTGAASRSARAAARRTTSRRCTCCPSAGPARCARWRRCPTGSATWPGRPTAAGSPSPAARATPATSAKDERWQSPRKIEHVLRPPRQRGLGVRPPRARVRRGRRRHRRRRATSRPARTSTRGVSWLADSSGVVTGGPGHEGWDRDLCEDVYVVPLDGPIRALTKQTGVYGFPSVSPDGSTRGVHRLRRPARRTRRTPRSA